MARVYAYLGEEMKWLWTKDLRTHTVHVEDVARGLWHSAEWYAGGKKNWTDALGKTPVFNLVDHGDTSTLPPPPPATTAPALTPHRPGLNANAHRQDLRH